MEKFLNKTKQSSAPLTSVGTEQECDACRASGRVPCIICQSKGYVKKFRTEQLKCEVCAGTGTMSAPCLACSGTGSATRRLRYEDKGAQSAIDQQGVLFMAKRTQVVSVLVKNVDEVVGKFSADVTLRDGKNTNSKGTITLHPGESAPVALSFFPVSRKDGFPAAYEIIPEEVEVACKLCSANGKLEKTCLACQGIGQAPTQRQIAEICPNCGGASEAKCSKCKGAGRIKE